MNLNFCVRILLQDEVAQDIYLRTPDMRDAAGMAHNVADRKPIAVHENESSHPAFGEFDGDKRPTGSEPDAKRCLVLEDGRFKDTRASQI